MADNVVAGAPVGTGATFRTDDVGVGVQVPFAKLMDGTDGSSAVIPGDATNGLYVNVKAAALPTGAATAAKQPALGTAGSASADVISVQGVASMTALKTDGSGVTQPVSDAGGSLTMDTPQLPTTLGQKAKAASTSVTLASDQDALPITDNGGSITVDGTVTITPSGTQTVAGGKTNNNAAPGATNIGALPAVANAAAPTQTEGNMVALRTNLAGDLAVTLDSEAVVLGAGSAAIGKLAANSGVDIGDVDVTSVPTDPFGVNADAASATGSISAKLRFIAATGIPITGTVTVGSHAVTNAGTFATQDSEKVADNAAFTDGTTKVQPAGFIFDEVAGTALTENDAAAARIDSKRALVFGLEDATTRGQRQAVNAGGAAEIHGDGAHGASVAGNPVLVGLEARTSDGTAVTNGQAVRAQADLNGKQIVLPYAIPENSLSGVTAAITGTADTSVIAAQGAGIRIYVTQILVINSHTTTGTVVEIKDNTTVIYRGYAAPVGGGFSITFPVPLRLTANVALQAANITTAANVYVSASGYKAP